MAVHTIVTLLNIHPPQPSHHTIHVQMFILNNVRIAHWVLFWSDQCINMYYQRLTHMQQYTTTSKL